MACKWPVVIHKLLPMFPNTMNYSQTTSLFPNTRNSYKLLPHSRTQRNKHKLRPCFQTQGIITNYFLVPKHKEFSQTTSLFPNTMNYIITNYVLVSKTQGIIHNHPLSSLSMEDAIPREEQDRSHQSLLDYWRGSLHPCFPLQHSRSYYTITNPQAPSVVILLFRR